MAGPKRPTGLFRACVSTCAVFASSFGVVRAADVTNSQPAPTDAPNPSTGWYVRLGAMGVLDRSSSNLYSQSIAGMIVPGIGTVPVGVGPQFQIPGLGASYSNFAGVSIQGGYSFTPNWSLEVASGFPMWATVTVNGSSPTGPPSGTVLSKLLPASVPITGVYHFTQFGRFQPYLGAGIAPTFALAVRDGYSTGAYIPTRAGRRRPGRLRLHAQPALGRLCRCEAGLRGGDGKLDRRHHGSVPGANIRHHQNQRPACRVLGRPHLSLLTRCCGSPHQRQALGAFVRSSAAIPRGGSYSDIGHSPLNRRCDSVRYGCAGYTPRMRTSREKNFSSSSARARARS